MTQIEQLQEILRNDYFWPDAFQADKWKRDMKSVLASLHHPMMEESARRGQALLQHTIALREQERGNNAFLDPALLDE